MAQQRFTTFKQVNNYIKKKVNVPMIRDTILRRAGVVLRDAVKNKYGVHQPGWAVSRSNPGSPLKKTGALRNSVRYRVSGWSVIVYTQMAYLALIHEYGATWKMTDKQRRYLFGVVFKDKSSLTGRPRSTHGTGMIHIPARPIWRRVLKTDTKYIEKAVREVLDKVFD